MEIPATTLFGALANESRLRALLLLWANGELCVCELTHGLGLSQPHVSRHLAQLREAGLVSDRREGIWVYYRINPQLPSWVIQILAGAAHALAGHSPYREDAHALASMSNRPGAPRCSA